MSDAGARKSAYRGRQAGGDTGDESARRCCSDLGVTTAPPRNASICSSDPLCIESTGQGLFSMNLSACHACGLLPETSCEEGNLLLDRVAAIGTPDNPTLGYFGSMIDE
jgi:hypothetical protein